MDFEIDVVINIIIAFIAYLGTMRLIPAFSEIFVASNQYGRDLNKKSDKKIPEGLGVISSAVYLMSLVVFMPIAFSGLNIPSFNHSSHNEEDLSDSMINYDRKQFIQFNSGLLSICFMTLFGFADDVLNLKWRFKLYLPAISAVPLLLVYYTNIGNTTVVVPKFLRIFIGAQVQLGPLYYLYMGMLAIFCTNAINILSGINGLEAGQSLIICLTIIIHNFIELSGPVSTHHKFSLYFMIPFFTTNLALLRYNWFPAKVFVGDTFCYTAGMTFAVVGILGRFSKTMLLFFIPQVANFVYSVPQLFHFLPCPRHRLPKFDPQSGLIGMSKARIKSKEITKIGSMVLNLAQLLRVVHVERIMIEDDEITEFNNLTLNNFVLKLCGPMKEDHLTKIMLTIQVLCSGIGFFIRYTVAESLY